MNENQAAGRRFSRRKFFVGALASLGVGAAAAGSYLYSRTPIRLALIGAGRQGQYLAATNAKAWWLGSYCGDIRAVCDVDRANAEAARHSVCKNAEIYSDYRKVLERDDIEAVLIATPDHWHAQIAIHAMRAGKAVYCEKPLSLTIEEGQQVVRAVAETGQVFLGGTQQRTDHRFRTAVELARNGRLGAIRNMTVSLPQRWVGQSEGPFPTQSPPKELDWNMWLGQAPWAEYCPERCHGYFRRWFEYSGGQMTDWGAHHIDIAQWALGVEHGGPLAVAASGNLPNIPNGYNTPIEFTVNFEYPGGVQLNVVTDASGARNGVRIEGDRSWLWVDRNKLEGDAVNEWKRNPLPTDAVRVHPSSPARLWRQVHHLLHFFRCIREDEAPVSDVLSQHRTASACHLANIALRLGRKISWNAASQEVLDDPQAQAMLTRPRRNGFAI